MRLSIPKAREGHRRGARRAQSCIQTNVEALFVLHVHRQNSALLPSTAGAASDRSSSMWRSATGTGLGGRLHSPAFVRTRSAQVSHIRMATSGSTQVISGNQWKSPVGTPDVAVTCPYARSKYSKLRRALLGSLLGSLCKLYLVYQNYTTHVPCLKGSVAIDGLLSVVFIRGPLHQIISRTLDRRHPGLLWGQDRQSQ